MKSHLAVSNPGAVGEFDPTPEQWLLNGLVELHHLAMECGMVTR